MNYYFGKRSKKKLATAHEDLQLIMNTAIRMSMIDFAIVEGHRSIELQQKYYTEGKSKVTFGKHNMNPSMAVDIVPYIDGKPKWDNEHLSFLSGMIYAISEQLLDDGLISHKIRWGGNFDMDGTILEQAFDDRPHFELVKP